MKFPVFLARIIPGIVLAGAFFAGSAGPHAMDWPAGDSFPTNNFGWNRRGRPLLGSILETGGTVRAADDGAVLFVHEAGSGASRLPSPLGYWAAVDHGDGLVSVYGRLDPEHPVPLEPLDRGRAIAEAEPSGAAGRQMGQFYFSVYDKKERRWVNPSMIITPREDTIAPQILDVELRSEDGRSYNPAAQNRRLAQGNYAVIVTASDSQSPARPQAALAPHRITCIVNGVEAASLAFETFSARAGILMAARNGLVPVREVYAPAPGWEAGKIWLTRGQAALEIIAQDVAGNTRNILYRLQVD